MRSASDVPGPRGTAVAGALGRLAVRPVGAFRELAAYGDIARLPLYPGRRLFVMSRPEHAEQVLARHQDNYVKAFTYRPLRALLDTGLLTSDGPLWRRHRRLIQPVFTRAGVAGFAPHVTAGALRVLERWEPLEDGTVLDVSEETSGLALDIVGRVLFGADLTAEAARVAEALSKILPAIAVGGVAPLLWSPRTGRAIRAVSRRLGGPVAVIDTTVERVIDRRRRAKPREDGVPTMLDFLLDARDEDGSEFTDAEIRDEVTTFMLTGHETTAVTLGWTLALLSAYPGARDRLEREADEVLGDRVPDAADLARLTWTRAVVNESMRLYPPAWTIERDAVRADVVDGTRIPAGSTVAVPPFLVHRHRDTWNNPEAFDPERFLSGEERHRYAFIPFGAGRRGCIGAGLAELEAVLVLAMIGRRYRLDLAGAFPVPTPHVTLRPGRRLPMRLTRREGAR